MYELTGMDGYVSCHVFVAHYNNKEGCEPCQENELRYVILGQAQECLANSNVQECTLAWRRPISRVAEAQECMAGA